MEEIKKLFFDNIVLSEEMEKQMKEKQQLMEIIRNYADNEKVPDEKVGCSPSTLIHKCILSKKVKRKNQNVFKCNYEECRKSYR